MHAEPEMPSLQDVVQTLKTLGTEGDLPPHQRALLDRALADLATLRSEGTAQPVSRPESEFRNLADHAPDLIVRFDREQRYLYVNPVVQEMTGLPPQAFIGKRNQDLEVPAEVQRIWDHHVAEALARGDPRRFQFTVSRPDGQTFYEARLVPEFAADGSVDSVVAIVRDVTGQKQAQQALQRYATRLSFLRRTAEAMAQAHAPDQVARALLPYVLRALPCQRASVALFDAQAKEALLLAVETETGTSLDEGLSLPIEWDWYVNELAQGHPCTVDLTTLDSPTDVLEAFRTEGIRALLGLPLYADGELLGTLSLGLATPDALSADQKELAGEMAGQLSIAIHKALLYDALAHYAGTLEESMARRTIALHRSDARFRTIFENAAVGMALVDLQGRVLTSNPALQRMLGYEAAELEAMDVTEFIHPDDIEARDRLFQELLDGDRDQFEMEKRYVRRDGSTIWVHPTVSLIRTPAGEPRYAIKMVEDVTAQREAREALIHADRLQVVGQLGASLAHEINNPLMSVITSLGLAEEMLDPKDEVHLYVQIALEELDRAATMVGQLRDLNRKPHPGDRELVQLNDLVARALTLTKKQAEHQEVEVRWQPGHDLPKIVVAPSRVHQALLNLVLNALDAMPGGGQLVLSTERTPEPAGLCVTVADSGRGIEPEALPHLFEPFYTTRREGLGLGLYISKSIVEEHGGHLEVKSTLGEGSAFRLWLPLEPGTAPEEGEAQDADE
jgi:PAS domain S-box-containing protein